MLGHLARATLRDVAGGVGHPTSRLTRLLRFARELQRANTVREMLDAIRAEVASELGFGHAWLMFSDRAALDELRLIDYLGLEHADVWEVAPRLTVAGDAMLEEIVKSDGPIVVVDARTDARTNKAMVAALENRTIVNVPLRGLDAPLYVLGTGTFGEEGCRPPSAEALEYLVGMAAQVAVAAARIRWCDERRRSAEEIERSEQLLRITLDSIDEAVITTNAADRIVRMNPCAETLTGWPARDAVGRPVEEVVVLEAATGGEAVLVTRQGRRRTVSRRTTSLKTADPAAQGRIVLHRDRTREHETQDALRESRAQATAVMEAALDAIVVIDGEGEIVEWNPAAERLFGYPREEVLGRALADIVVPPSLRGAHRGGLARLLATGQPRLLGRRVELTAIRRDGDEFPVEVAIVESGSAERRAFTGYIRDITERRKAAEAEILRREKSAALAANAELEAFSYSVAHDLRAPLRSISGFSDVLGDHLGDRLDAEGRALLGRIIGATSRMDGIIEALLSLARLTRTELRRETVDLAQIADAVIARLRAREPTRQVELVNVGEKLAIGDRGLLTVVLENLLGNAWKFTSARPVARIELGRTTTDTGATVFFVRDDGAGFDMSFVGKLFVPFQRLHAAREFAGTGIGLATVARIVARHGGRIWAEGAIGKGATFSFVLEPPQRPSLLGIELPPAPPR